MISLSLGVTGPRRNAFNPRAIPGIVAWYSPRNASSITLIGGLISQINDLSGNGNHAVQTDAARRPSVGSYGGRSTISLGGSQWLDLPPALYSLPGGDNSALIVGMMSGLGTSTQHLIAGNNSTTTDKGWYINTVGNGTALRAQSSPVYGQYSSRDILPDTSVHVYGIRRTGSSIISILDGLQGSVASGANCTLDNLFIGRSDQGTFDYWRGDIGDVLIFKRSLPSDQMNMLGANLGKLYGEHSWTNM